MADEGFKSKLAPILSTAINDLDLKHLRHLVDSPKDNIQPTPYYAYGGNMRLEFLNLRNSLRCFSSQLLPAFLTRAFLIGCTSESKGPQYENFPPAGGKGAIVLALSG